MQCLPPLLEARCRTGLLAASLAATVLAQPAARAQAASTPVPAAQTDQEQVASVDDQYVAAELRHDEAAMRLIVDDRFVFNSAQGGTTLNKDQWVRSVLTLPMTGQSVRERSVLVEGDMAFVFATTDLRFASPGDPDSATSFRYTSAYVRRDGKWRMLVLQMQPRAGTR